LRKGHLIGTNRFETFFRDSKSDWGTVLIASPNRQRSNGANFSQQAEMDQLLDGLLGRVAFEIGPGFNSAVVAERSCG
jgi:hypothetical protein